MPFAEQNGQKNMTSVLTDRCNFNLTWKSKRDVKGRQKTAPPNMMSEMEEDNENVKQLKDSQ